MPKVNKGSKATTKDIVAANQIGKNVAVKGEAAVVKADKGNGNGKATTAKATTTTDNGLHPKRAAVLAYLLKKKAVDAKSAVKREVVWADAGVTGCVTKALRDEGYIARADHEDGTLNLHLTAKGKKAVREVGK